MQSTVYLIPAVLSEGRTEALPVYISAVVKKCSVFFVENERTARRYFKTIWPEMRIDDFEWYVIKEMNIQTEEAFKQKIIEQRIIGIVSEAGCPGIADPGQNLVRIAQSLQVSVIPLVGPNSIILALMASGMNGQNFRFMGYLPIEASEKLKAVKMMESDSRQNNCTQIFIETPYRNNQMIETLLKACKPHTHLCVASELTGETEWIRTMTIAQWRTNKPDLHKKPSIFLIYAGH